MNERIDVSPDAIAREQKYLYRYALTRLRDADLAQDVVQDTIVAAMEASERFQGKASLRTWLVAILRNKIVDAMKTRARLVSLETDPSREDALDEDVDRQFNLDGRWATTHRPTAWANPETTFENTQFWTVFERCLEHVPPRTAEVFVLREVLGETIAEICKILELSASNCSVMLFRARMRLKGCLEVHWFSERARKDA